MATPSAHAVAIPELLQRAVTLHSAGNRTGAEALYDVVLQRDAANPDALNLKGVLANDEGRHAQALAFFDRAIGRLPGFAQAHFNRGNALQSLGHDEAAITAFLHAAALKPPYPEAQVNAGAILHKLGRLHDAIAAFESAAAAAPTDARPHLNLGSSLTDLAETAGPGESISLHARAETALERALLLSPESFDVRVALSRLLSKLHRHADAAEHLQTALAIKKDISDAQRARLLSDLGELLRKSQDPAAGLAANRQAALLQPDDKLIRFNLAVTLADGGQQAEAEEIYRDLIRRDPRFLRPYINLSNIYREQDRLPGAMKLLEDALAIDPAFAEAYTALGALLSDHGWINTSAIVHRTAVILKPHDLQTRFDFATVLLRAGRLAEGWDDYEYRYDAANERLFRRATPPPYWNGEDLKEKSILVWTEQGVGDEILCGALIGELIARAGRVVIECSSRLVPIFLRAFPKAHIAGWTVSNRPVTAPDQIDFQIAASSLGRFFRRSFDSFPRTVTAFAAEQEKTAALRAKYRALAGGRRIAGIAWRSKNEKLGPHKSMALEDLAGLLATPGVLFVNLQYGDCAAEIAAARKNPGVEIFDDPAVDSLSSLDDFFAQVAAMDLVITTSNTAAHVAGSQGVPVWILLPNIKGTLWYWFNKRADSPFYSSARLFRGTFIDSGAPGNAEVIGRATDYLVNWVNLPLTPRT